MDAEGAVQALRALPGSWLRQRTAQLRPVSFTCVTSSLLVLLLSACASVDVRMLSTETFPPDTGQVEMLDRAPNRAYVQIAVLTVDSWWLSEDSKREQIREKAATLGADAVIFGPQYLSPSPRDNRVKEPSAPPASNHSEEIGQATPNALHSSAYQGTPADDVRVFLVRGGHGGGGHGRGGHWGHSRHPGFRPGGHWHYRGYWGGGFYGPGWWGPGPYWGGYYPYAAPYWGGYGYYRGYAYPYSYPNYGYMNTVTVGTAIRYTD